MPCGWSRQLLGGINNQLSTHQDSGEDIDGIHSKIGDSVSLLKSTAPLCENFVVKGASNAKMRIKGTLEGF